MKYKRLAVSKRGLGKWHTLWLGDDHLLSVESTGYSEEYKRYYLKDIQAIISRRSGGGKVLNGIFGTMVAISLLAGIGGYENGLTPVSVTAAIFGGFFLLLLLWNLFRGPTCRCHIRTPVGIDELPALDRVRSAKKALERVRPLIGRLQGEVPRKVISELTGQAGVEPPASPGPVAVKAPHPAGPAAENPASPYRGGFHLAAFSLLVIDGAVSLYQIEHSPDFLNHVSTGLMLIFMIFAIFALVKQTNTPLPSQAKWMIWGGIGTIASGIIIGSIFVGFFVLGNIQNGSGATPNSYNFDTATVAAAHPGFAFYLLVYALLEAFIGIAGLIALGRGQGRDERRRA
jgi:multidrug transporter EmrE-like cation transporter